MSDKQSIPEIETHSATGAIKPTEDWYQCPKCDEWFDNMVGEHVCPAPSKLGEWISVEDRLPEASRILAYGEGYSPFEGYKLDIFVCDYSESGNWFVDCGDELAHVTHWQPLPDPPEVEDE